MKLYKITVRPVSSYCSPLQSDTFFGAFCWSYLYRYGQDALLELVDHYQQGQPEVILSNAFPAGMLPVPIGADIFGSKGKEAGKKTERYHAYMNQKDKPSFIPLEDFNQVINGNAITFSGCRAMKEAESTSTSQWRNLVRRESGTVERIGDESGLFEVWQHFTKGFFDIYILSTLDQEVLDLTLRDMFFYGIGAQRSVGKGQFEIVAGTEEFHGFLIPENANAFLALSNFVPSAKDPVEGYYQAFVKYPKVSQTDSEGDSPFKKPVVFLEAGSVFADRQPREYYGSCLTNIALKGGKVSDSIITGAYTIAIPCRMPEEIFD